MPSRASCCCRRCRRSAAPRRPRRARPRSAKSRPFSRRSSSSFRGLRSLLLRRPIRRRFRLLLRVPRSPLRRRQGEGQQARSAAAAPPAAPAPLPARKDKVRPPSDPAPSPRSRLPASSSTCPRPTRTRRRAGRGPGMTARAGRGSVFFCFFLKREGLRKRGGEGRGGDRQEKSAEFLVSCRVSLRLCASLHMRRTCITRAAAAPQLPQGGGSSSPRGGSGEESDAVPPTNADEGAHAVPPALLSWKLLPLLVQLVDGEPSGGTSSPAAPR